jgi:hypothetical protein
MLSDFVGAPEDSLLELLLLLELPLELLDGAALLVGLLSDELQIARVKTPRGARAWARARTSMRE